MNARHHALRTLRLTFAAFTARILCRAARYVVGARPSKFHHVSCDDNTLAASLRTHVPLDEHIHACNCGCKVPSTSSVNRFRQAATMWRLAHERINPACEENGDRHIPERFPTIQRCHPTGRGSSRLVLCKLIRGIVARLARLGQNLSGRRLGLRRPLVHARVARCESSKGSRRQYAILGNG